MKLNYLINRRVLRAAVVASLCVFSMLATTAYVAAQDATTGKVSGVIKDPNGAAVSGAEVSLLHQQRAVVATTNSDANGAFTLANVAPGYYEVKVTGPGFTEFRKAIEVTAGSTSEVTVSMLVNQVSEEVTVSAEAGQVVNARSIDQRVNVIHER